MANEALEVLILSVSSEYYYHVKASFVRQHLDNRDVIYDQASNKTLSNRIESGQYKAALAITGAIKGSFWEKYTRNYV